MPIQKGTQGRVGCSEKKLEGQRERASREERNGESEGLLTQQELSAKAGVRQGASVYVCVCNVREIVATCQIQ